MLICKDHARFELKGPMTFQEAVLRLKLAVEAARKKRIAKLLIDVREIEKIDVPGIGQRYWLVTEMESSAQGAVKIVMIARPEFIDHEKVGVTIAANRNLDMNIFATEADALAWLLAP